MKTRFGRPPTHPNPYQLHRDERGVILSWFVKMLVGFALVAVILFDAGAVAVNYFGLDSAATDIANGLAVNVADRSLSGAIDIEAAAQELATEHGAKLLRAELDEDAVLHIKLRRTANTLIVKRISAFADWGVATSEAQSGTQPH